MTEPTSDLLQEIRDNSGGERITLGEMMDSVGGRAYGGLLILLGLPEAVPMIGLSAILALPILVIGAYMVAYGERTPLPDWLRRRSLPRDKVRGAIDRTLPVVRWLDRVSRPRWPALASAARLQGTVCVVMALVLAIPVPGINLLAAFAVVGTGIGIVQRDGLLIGASLFAGGLAVGGMVAVALGAAAWIGGG